MLNPFPTCNRRQLRKLNQLVPPWPLRNVRHPPLVPLLKVQLFLLGEFGEVGWPYFLQAVGARYRRGGGRCGGLGGFSSCFRHPADECREHGRVWSRAERGGKGRDDAVLSPES